MDDRTAPEPLADDERARIQASFDRQGLMAHLGAQLGLTTDGEVHVVLPHRPEVTQQHGFIHAGATSAIADSAGGYAALTRFADGDEVLTVEFKLNLLAPADGDHLEAVGTVVRSGRTLTVCRHDVYAHSSAGRAHVATGQSTLIRIGPSPAV